MIKEIVTHHNYEDDISKELEAMYYKELINLIEEAAWKSYDPDKDSDTCSVNNGEKWYQRKSFLLEVLPSGHLTVFVDLGRGEKEYLITSRTYRGMEREYSVDFILRLIK